MAETLRNRPIQPRLGLAEAGNGPRATDASTRAFYDNVEAVLDLPILNTDHRALARWPSYFALAWADLRPRIRGPAQAAASRRLHDLAVTRSAACPIRRGCAARACAPPPGRTRRSSGSRR